MTALQPFWSPAVRVGLTQGSDTQRRSLRPDMAVLDAASCASECYSCLEVAKPERGRGAFNVALLAHPRNRRRGPRGLTVVFMFSAVVGPSGTKGTYPPKVPTFIPHPTEGVMQVQGESVSGLSFIFGGRTVLFLE